MGDICGLISRCPLNNDSYHLRSVVGNICGLILRCPLNNDSNHLRSVVGDIYVALY